MPEVTAAALEEALGHAYAYLGARERTEFEVERCLRRRGVAESTIEACLAELREQRYLDDVRFAEGFARERRELDGWGSERIRDRLMTLGVERELADRVAGADGPEAEMDAAVELLRRRLRVPPEDDRERGRALGLLVRRGYPSELAHDAVRRFERDWR